MPMSMYEIRNEYSLADPELYRAADKDNPEALLEGVAMAGLVGVLRQLGDLAEFAAEIFHDLHEEVMATAARGHDLLIRVQQLESEVPSIEKAFLSQTDQSSFFYSAGFDWRTNLRMEQNLVTQGDLPRFIMDSYEECRGPPRLFLLDKFDVTGTGACLKRYTDPSFFKVETSEITSLDVQRENKIRKTKKKGPRWRNRETPEVLPTPHVKLHQLFLEDRVENGVRNPARRVKLKRRLNGFPFDSRTGKSYMEKLLESPSPEHKVLHDVYVSSSLVMLPTNDHNESALEVVEFGTVNPERESKERKISHSDREKNMPNPSINEPKEIIRDDNICEVSNSYASVVADEISYTVDKLDGENDIAVNGESKTEGTLTGYQSDDIASEIENYMDASSTMGSEMDTDSELQLKSDFTSSLLKTQPSYANGDLHSSSSDSQSTGEPRMYDAWNNLSKNKTSSFSSSGSLSTSAENPHLDKFLSARLPSADIPDIDIVDDVSSYQKTTDEDFPVDQHPNPVDFDYNCSNTDAITNQWSDFEQLPSSLLCTSDSIHMLSHSDSEEVRKDRIMGQLEHLAFASDDEHRKISLAVDRPCSPNTLDSKSRSGDHSPPSAAHEHLNDEPNIENLPSIYTVISYKDRSIQMFSDLLHEDDADHEDLSLGKNTASSSNMSNGRSQSIYDAPEMITIEYPIGGKKDGEVSELTEKVCSDCPDIADNGHSSLSTEVPKEEKITDKLDHKDSNILHFSFIMEASHGKELSEASSSMVHNVNADEHYSSSSIHNQCSSENTLLQYAEDPPDWPEDVIDPHDSEVVPQEESTINATSASGTSESHKVVGLHGPEFTDGLFANDSAAMKSCGTQEFLEAIAGPSDKVAGPSDKVQHDRITLYTDPIGLQVDETLVTTDINLLIKYVHDVEQLETADKASPAPAVSDNANKSLDKLIEELTPRSVDSNTEEVEDDSNSLSESHGELGLVEEVGQAEATSPNLSSQSCNNINNIDNGHLKLEASNNVPGPDLVSNVAHSLDFVDVATIESVQAQSGLDREHESVQQSSPRIHVYDASSSPIDSDNEEIISQSNIRANQLIDEFPDSEVIRLGLSPLFSVNLQQIADHDDHKEDNSSESMFTLVNYPSPPSFYELPRTRNYDNNITGQPKDPLGSIFPPSNVSYETNQINLNELPPLPPLPPVQWRMGKLLQASSITGEIMKPKSFPVLTFPPLAPTDAINSSLDVIGQSFLQITPEISPEEKNEHGSPSFDANAMDEKFDLQPGIENEMLQFITSTDAVKSSLNETNHSPIHIVLENAPSSEKVENEPNNEKVENEPNNEKAEHILSSQEVCTMDKKTDLQPDIDNEKRESNTSHDDVSFTSTDAVKSSLNETNHSPIHIVLENAPSSEKVENEPNNEKVENEPNNEKAEHILSSQEVCTMDKKIDLQPDIGNEKRESNTSHDDVSFSLAEMIQSSFHINPVIASEPEQQNFQPSTSRSDANALHEPKILPSKVENEKLQLLVPFSVRELPLPAEDEVSHGTRVKLPWPRNPLVDDVAALDKGKLRKVTERVVPEIQKVDERDSLLVQIRNKSFNLKPAMASRPSIRGPRTNLKVAAILEKANQIRQAFAGSDEDDDDNWSDS